MAGFHYISFGAPDNTPQELGMQHLTGQLKCSENICDH